jgi:hypothetical protein
MGTTVSVPDPDAWIPQVDPDSVAPAQAPAAAPATPDPGADYVPEGTPAAPAQPGGLEMDQPFMTRAWHSLTDWMSGASHTPDVMKGTPELTARSDLPKDAGIKLAAQYFLSGDPNAIADTAVKALPGAVRGEDAFHNPTVTWNGQTSYVNKPGMSTADLIGTFGDAALAYPAAKMIASIKALGGITAINTLIRSGAQGVGQGLTSVVRDLGSWALGSDQGIDPEKAVQAAAGGAAAEPALAVGGTVGRALGRAGGAAIYPSQLLTKAATSLAPDAALTPDLLNTTGTRIMKVLTDQGIDTSDMTVGQMRKFMSMLPPGTSPQLLDGSDQAKTSARNMYQSARFEIPMTLGQITGDQSQLGREDWLRHTTQPPSANAIMRQQGDRVYGTNQQPGALDTALNTQVPGTPPGTLASTPAEQGQAIQAALTKAQADARTATTNAYTAVGTDLTKPGMNALPLGQGVIFTKDASQNLLDSLAALRRTQAVPDGVIKRISQLTAPQGTGQAAIDYVNGDGGVSNVATQPFNLGDFNEARRYITGLSPANATEARAIGQVRDAMDAAVNHASSTGAIVGDPDMLARYQNAVATAKQAFANFQPSNEAAANFIKTATTPGASGSDIVDGLFGGGRLGFGGDTTQILDHLDTLFPPGTPARDVIRQAAARRMLFGTDMNPATLSPNNISNRISNVIDPASKGYEIADRLFTPEEMATFKNFGDTMDTLKQSATKNPSGTSYAIADALKRAGATVPMIGKAFTDEASAIADAKRATAGGLSLKTPRPTDMPISSFRTTVAPAIGGAAGREGNVAPVVRTVGTGLLHALPPYGNAQRGLLQ